MRPFVYHRPGDPKALEAILVGPPQNVPPTSASAQFLAGGTTILDLMKLNVAQPEILILNSKISMGSRRAPPGYGSGRSREWGMWLVIRSSRANIP
jgi:xanthine dehydrogenase YagS FAD-binding subunit